MQRIKELGKDELVRGSIILFITIGIFNFFNYIFHFSMARILGPSDYGVLAVLMSIIYIFSIPSEAIQTVISRYTSKYNVKKEYGKIKDLLYKSMKKGIFFSIIIFIISIPVAYFLAGFLKIEFFLLLLTNFFIFYVFITPITRGVLQGRKKFVSLGMNMVLESSIKVVLAIFFVFIGWKVYGAMASIFVAGFIAFIAVFFLIKEIISSKRQQEDFKGIYNYSVPVSIAMISVVLMYSLDIILAKRFFSPELAGAYSVASMLGKMIFFGTFAIGKAMFPLTSERYEDGKKTSSLLRNSLKIVALISIIVLLFYLFIPELIIKILFGSQYIKVANILFIVGLSLTFLSFSNLIILYNLSINKMKKSFLYLLGFVFLEVILFFLFHSSLLQFSLVFLIVNFLMLIYTILLNKKLNN